MILYGNITAFLKVLVFLWKHNDIMRVFNFCALNVFFIQASHILYFTCVLPILLSIWSILYRICYSVQFWMLYVMTYLIIEASSRLERIFLRYRLHIYHVVFYLEQWTRYFYFIRYFVVKFGHNLLQYLVVIICQIGRASCRERV